MRKVAYPLDESVVARGPGSSPALHRADGLETAKPKASNLQATRAIVLTERACYIRHSITRGGPPRRRRGAFAAFAAG